MKLRFGLYQHMLNKQHFAFAKQSSCTHMVVQLVDYLNKGTQLNQNSCTIKKLSRDRFPNTPFISFVHVL